MKKKMKKRKKMTKKKKKRKRKKKKMTKKKSQQQIKKTKSENKDNLEKREKNVLNNIIVLKMIIIKNVNISPQKYVFILIYQILNFITKKVYKVTNEVLSCVKCFFVSISSYG